MGGEGGSTEGRDEHQFSTAENRNPHAATTEGVLRLTLDGYKPSHFSLPILYRLEIFVNYKKST